MHRKILAIVFFVFTTAAAHAAENVTSAKEISFLKSWFSQQTATGNWNGLRGRLDNRGLNISSNYTADFGVNPVGGLTQGEKYCGFLEIAFALDLEKLASLKGAALTISNFLASGKNLSDNVGDFFGVQEIYTSGSYFFGELDLSLSLLEDKLTFEAGRLFAGDVFATSPLFQYYINSGVNDNLNSIGANIFFPKFNIAAWGARVTCQPKKEWHFVAAIYDADTRAEDSHKHGLYFKVKTNKGYLALGQAAFTHNQGKSEKGLPGSVTFGGYYQSGRFQYLADSTKDSYGNYGCYLILDQMIYRGSWPHFKGPDYLSSSASDADRIKQPYHPRAVVSADRPKGLTAWLGLYYAPPKNINTQRYQVAGGLVYQGLPPGRNRDVTALGVIAGHYSDVMEPQGTEIVVELNHRFQFSQWFYLTPDVQYVIHPSGYANIDDALVLGCELSINF